MNTKAYVIHQLVSGRDARDAILEEKLLDSPFKDLIESHEGHVANVDTEQDEGLPPVDVRVSEKEDEGD